MSSNGVPSRTSIFEMYMVFSSILSNFTTEEPMRFGLFGDLVAKTPCVLLSIKGFTSNRYPSTL